VAALGSVYRRGSSRVLGVETGEGRCEACQAPGVRGGARPYQQAGKEGRRGSLPEEWKASGARDCRRRGKLREARPRRRPLPAARGGAPWCGVPALTGDGVDVVRGTVVAGMLADHPHPWQRPCRVPRPLLAVTTCRRRSPSGCLAPSRPAATTAEAEDSASRPSTAEETLICFHGDWTKA
jgi:hypothetical protein